jgi:hypothetical protein
VIVTDEMMSTLTPLFSQQNRLNQLKKVEALILVGKMNKNYTWDNQFPDTCLRFFGF